MAVKGLIQGTYRFHQTYVYSLLPSCPVTSLSFSFSFWTREGHRQSDEHWNRFKGNAGETSERRGGAHMGFSERMDTILSKTELDCSFPFFLSSPAKPSFTRNLGWPLQPPPPPSPTPRHRPFSEPILFLHLASGIGSCKTPATTTTRKAERRLHGRLHCCELGLLYVLVSL